MTGRLGAATLAVTLMTAGTAAAQAIPGPFSGSVVKGAASAGVLPLALSEALTRGLEYNLGIVAFDQQAESARGSRLRTLRELMPRVDARMGETRQTTNLAAFGFDPSLFPGMPSIVGPFNIFDARVAASQAVFDPAAVQDLRSKTAAVSAATFDARNARDLVTYVVTSLYFQAVAGESRIDTARSQVATAEALLSQATNLRDAGAAPGIDVIRAQVQLQAQRQRLIAAESEQAKQTIQLARAVGLPASQRLQLSDRTLTLSSAGLTVDEAVARATSNRADYRASLERVHAAEASARAAKASLIPSVRVAGDYGAIGSNPGSARRTYSMSAQVRMALFDQDRQGRQVETAAAFRQREAEAADLVQRIEAEVRTAFLDVQAAEQQLAVGHERVGLANQELALARVRFTAGVTSNLEVIQAQNEVATATDADLSAAYALNIARAALARAVGPSN